MAKTSEPMKTLKKNEEEKNKIYTSFIKASQKFRKPSFNKKVSYGKTQFKYADLAEILDCVTKPLLDEGFFIVHDFYNENEIHYIKTYLQYSNGKTLGNVVFPITVANKSMQEIGAQITYLKRYSVASICNICAEEDNDAKEIENTKFNKSENISPNQTKWLEDLLSRLPDFERNNLLQWCNVSDLNQIPKSKFQQAKNALEDKIAKLKGE